ncbi:MAG TPA: glycosyltransferase [Rhizobiales bacterium]|nr:glycosyltransferase [Hyphomicrobiales bacterium]
MEIIDEIAPPGSPPEDAGNIELSIVVPMWNEEESIDIFFEKIEPVLQSICENYEIICIDDGSTDATMSLLVKHRVRDPRIKVLSLSRNFGKDIALSAGLNNAHGKAVVPMDVDLQDPPEVIADMYARKQEGFDVVIAVRSSRQSDTIVKRLTARLFYRLHNSMADVTIPHDTGDFRMLDQRVVQVLRHLPERNRFMKGLFSWVGFTHATVEYERQPRAAGTTKWKYWKLWNFALDGITSSSTLPLRIWTYLGTSIAAMAFLYAAWLIVKVFVYGADVPGYASTMVTILFLGGINILATGIFGEYLGRVYVEVRNRPLYVVRETHGLQSQETEQAPQTKSRLSA